MLAKRIIEKAEKITSAFRNASSHSLTDKEELVERADIIITAVNMQD